MRSWGRDGGSECRCRVGEKSDCPLRLRALRWVSFPPSPSLIPTFLLSYHSLKSCLCVGSFFMPFSLSFFYLTSSSLLFPSFQSPLLCFHPMPQRLDSLKQLQCVLLNIYSLMLWEPLTGRNCIWWIWKYLNTLFAFLPVCSKPHGHSAPLRLEFWWQQLWWCILWFASSLDISGNLDWYNKAGHLTALCC